MGKMIERYIKQLESALADTWYTLEDLYDSIRESGLACTFDDLMDRHRAAIESAKAECPTTPEATPPSAATAEELNIESVNGPAKITLG